MNETSIKKYCLYCRKEIPSIKIDSLGRHNTRTSKFCDNNNKCRNLYLRKVQHPDYYKIYYKNNKEKYKAKNEPKQP
jgi:hypothetical protein